MFLPKWGSIVRLLLALLFPFFTTLLAADPTPPVLLKGHKGTLTCLAYDADGKSVVARFDARHRGIDRNVALWDFGRLLMDYAKK